MFCCENVKKKKQASAAVFMSPQFAVTVFTFHCNVVDLRGKLDLDPFNAMAHLRSKIHDTSQNDETNKNILLKERYDLLKWSTNVEMRTPNLLIPVQIANYVESLPFCKLAVSPKCDCVALMSYSRQLDIYHLNGEILEHQSSVQVLEELCPEYCLLQFSSSSTLLLSSRSTPHIDVFDNMGAYCYDIPLEAHEGIFDVNSAVCGMQTIPNNSSSSNDKFIDILYVLQYNGIFSAFKIGRLSKYTKMYSVQLDIGKAGSFVVLPQFRLLVVSAHHNESKTIDPPAGLCRFRMNDTDPYVDPIKIYTSDGGFFSRLPFSTAFWAYLPNLSLSFDSSLLVSVSTSGNLYLFDIPSFSSRFTFDFISGPRPVEACFVDFIEDKSSPSPTVTHEIAVIYDTGYLLRCKLEDLEEKMYSMKVKGKKDIDEDLDHRDIYSEHTVMVSPAQREIFLLTADGDNSLLHEAAHKRVQLAGQLWFYTVWNSFKKLVGMAMGEPAEQLQMATHTAKFDFTLIHSPTRSLLELFNRTLVEHDYTRARELAETYPSIDINVVLKAEWTDKCLKNKVTVEDVEEILHRIEDSEWVAAQCAETGSEDFEVHKALLDLGLSLGESSVMWQIRLLHHLRMLEVCRINGDIDMYLMVRNRSCLDAGLTFAHNGDIDSLTQIIESNWQVMKKHQKRILSAIPTCTSPTKYEILMPKRDEEGDEDYEQWELEEQHDGILERMNQIALIHPDATVLINNVNVGNVEDEEPFDFVGWVRETLTKIDFECGMTDNCVNLLRIAVERGFSELVSDLGTWERYSEYIRICASISESITSFQDSTIKSVISRFARLLGSELIENAQQILDLIEWKVSSAESDESLENRVREAVTELMKQANERTTKVLVAYRKERPDIIDDQIILEVLLNMTSTGADLMKSLSSLPVDKYTNVTSSLGSLMSRGVKMTFKSIFESMKEPDGARRVLIKLSRSGNCKTIEEWQSLRDDVYDMAKGIYGDLVTTEDALELIAGEILEDERIGGHPELMDLVLTLNPKQEPIQNERKLSVAKSADVLLTKSDELMSEATQKNDPLLGKSRFFAVAARPISPKKAKEKLDWLDAIDAALELGCTMMPIAIKLSAHDSLLRDVVKLGTNYKQGKKILNFAKQLNIDTPIATALSYCALAALNANDAVYLSKYIGEVMKAKNVPVVHQLCMKIMDSPHVPTDMEDVYACAMLNSSDENLLATVDAISASEKRLNETIRTREMIIEDLPVSENVVGDPMYTPMRLYNPRKEASGNMKQKLQFFEKYAKRDNIELIKRLYAHESSTVALALDLLHPSQHKSENELSWTNNDKLKRYERSLRFFEERVPLSILVKAPVSNLIKEANKDDKSITAMDRIEDYGCDRKRFIGDAEYRAETIIGLAGTDNEQVFADALELAQKYGVDEWQLHMASLEYLLDPMYSVPLNEVKQLMKSRGHLSKLRTRLEDFHQRLRSMVLPSLETNEQFIAYTSLFAETEPEKKIAPTIKKILEKKKNVEAIKMWNEVKYLSTVLSELPDVALRSITASILQIPNVGVPACEKAAEFLLDGNENRPPSSPYTLFLLMRSNVEEFLDLVANKKSRDDEIAYLDHAVVLLENTPNAPSHLTEAVRSRAEKMRRSTVTPEPSNGSTSFFSRPEDNTGMMKRRKN
uniref:Neuroblastoma-amplified sequence n=2 Tax=Caenorhabditis japonica TaxID=281687 RepID=A0A8R1DIM8_CAEJA